MKRIMTRNKQKKAQEREDFTIDILKHDEIEAMRILWNSSEEERRIALNEMYGFLHCHRHTTMEKKLINDLGSDYEVKIMNIYYWLKNNVNLKNREAC